ncbi:MAG TPA: lipoyl synthase [Myxococcota bacterium]|nr:lipoyl synthase [Myxococcota bacterium]
MSAGPRPSWIRARYQQTPELERLLELVRSERLHTVCQSAACPNLGECWAHGTATFMIAGNQCTRACGFCDVATGRPAPLDAEEPARVAHAIAELGLRFAVVTAVARDDLDDGGAEHFARTIAAIRARAPGCRVEVLIPDLKGSLEALRIVLDASPDVLNHNLETVERLQRPVRKAGRYDRSLALLANSARLRPDIPTKTGLMLGLGEREDEIRTALADIRAHGCRLLTIGQYLAPSAAHLPVDRWVTPKEFEAWADEARALGFDEVFSGPLVRSSYRAEKLARAGLSHGHTTRAPEPR